ncbi:MAG: hypothetical protein H7Z42_20345 [Roseiflexaceae bacterium]|nr:hypothetical protein [Roseiflexaceae bacterium]
MISTETSTFVQLRQLLDQTERDMVAIKSEPAKAAPVIRQVERAERLIAELRGAGVDVRAEQSRADSLRGRLLHEAELVVKRVGQNQPPLAGSALWQELQATVAVRRSQARRKLLITLGVVGTLAVLLFGVLPALFPAPPTANTVAVGQLVSQNDDQGALALALQEQAAAPGDPQIGLWIGALQAKQGNTAAAQASYAAARALASDEVAFLSDRVLVLMSLGDLAAAEQDATALQAIDGGAAIGTYHLGALREQAGDRQAAMALYEQAGALAERENRPELVVAARTRMATLMQGMQ